MESGIVRPASFPPHAKTARAPSSQWGRCLVRVSFGPGVVAWLDPRRPPATLWDPAGVGRGAGGGSAGVWRPKGPAVLPARPSGPGRTDHDLCRPNGPTVPLDARAVRGTVGPLGRTGWGWQPPGPSTLAGRTAGPLGRTTDHLDVKSGTSRGTGPSSLHPGDTRGVEVGCPEQVVAKSNHPARCFAVKFGRGFRVASDPTDLVSVVKEVCG